MLAGQDALDAESLRLASGVRPLRGTRAVLTSLWIACGVFAVWSQLGRPGAAEAPWFSDLLLATGGLAGVAVVSRAARCTALETRVRRAWWMLAIAFAFWNAGDWSWLWIARVQGADPNVGWPDVAYLLFYPFAFLALVTLPQPKRRPDERLAFWLDVGAASIGTAFGLWYLIVLPAAREAGPSFVAQVLAVAYPVGDLALLFALVIVFRAGHSARGRRALLLLGASFGGLLAADIGWAVLTLGDGYESGGLQDVIYLASTTLCAHAACAQVEDASIPERSVEAATRRIGVAYAGVAIGYALLLYITFRPAADGSGFGLVVGAAIASTCLVIGRQLAASREHLRALRDESLRAGEARFRALVQNATDVVAIVSRDGRIEFASPSVARITGRSAESLPGLPISDLVVEEDVERVEQFVAAAAAAPGATERVQWRARGRLGRPVEIEVTGNNLLGESSVRGIVLNIRDVSERVQLERDLVYQALHDPLTGLANRALLYDRLEHALQRAQRSGDALAVALLDLDHFKGVNDGLGHAAGDQLLRDVARRIGLRCRKSDTAARLGGDEFAILLEEVGTDHDLRGFASRMLDAFRDPFDLDGRPTLVGASVGVARATAAHSAEQVLRDADLALYHAKKNGRGCFQVYEGALHESFSARVELEADLRRALAEDEFRVHFQPIVELESGRIVGAEALVRWPSPKRGNVPPSDFVPVAEEIGLIGALGAWVLRAACREAASWPVAGSDAPILHVNLSGNQLLDAGLPAQVRATLAEAGLAPARLLLEVTETVAMRDTERTLSHLEELRALGVQIAIDDFGTGYSSLAYLHRFPIDELKIDRTFVSRIGERGGDDPVIAAILALARSIDLRVVAEGIETQEQRAALQRQGCRYGQGYLFARPLDAEALRAALAGPQSQRSVAGG